MIHFVYNYKESPAVWREILYSIKSIHKFCKDDFKIFVIGDHVAYPGVVNIKANHLKNRVSDHYNKLSVACQHSGINHDFILMYDDQVFLRPFSFKNFHTIIAHELILDIEAYLTQSPASKPSQLWSERLMTTFNKVQETCSYFYNYETHLPRLLNKDKVCNLLSSIKPTSEILFASLYFNLYYNGPDITINGEPLRYGIAYVHYPHSINIHDKINKSWILNYNDNGCTEVLKRSLIQLFD